MELVAEEGCAEWLVLMSTATTISKRKPGCSSGYWINQRRAPYRSIRTLHHIV